MTATVIYGDRVVNVPNVAADGDNLWLSTAELTLATGWELKPQGACLGERCVPLPAGRAAEFSRADGQFNLTAFARHLGQPFAHDEQHAIWSFGQVPDDVTAQLKSLEAPDFTLPDLDGKMHSLADYRGTKVLLMSWASW